MSGDDTQITNDSCPEQSDAQCFVVEKSKSASTISERVKQKSWYNVIYPSYKSRCETFKKLFKEVPDDQRLVVGKCLNSKCPSI